MNRCYDGISLDGKATRTEREDFHGSAGSPGDPALIIEIVKAHKQQGQRIDQLGKMIAPHRKPIKPRQRGQKVTYLQ
jgi:hypothetical protein